MQTKQNEDLEKSPFYGLFQRHPWLVPTLGMVNRQLGAFRNSVNQQVGIMKEFYEIYVKPHSRE